MVLLLLSTSFANLRGARAFLYEASTPSFYVDLHPLLEAWAAAVKSALDEVTFAFEVLGVLDCLPYCVV